MANLLRTLAAGAAAGAAGTAALDAVTYLDMAIRGRASSDIPERTVEAVAAKLHLDIPGGDAPGDDRRAARLSALGALSGLATGVAVGVLAAAPQALTSHRRTGPLGALLIGAGAMALANGSMTILRVTDPRTWSAADWAADVVPHVAYGIVTATVLNLALAD